MIVLQSLFERQFEGTSAGNIDAFSVFDLISQQTFEQFDLQAFGRTIFEGLQESIIENRNIWFRDSSRFEDVNSRLAEIGCHPPNLAQHGPNRVGFCAWTRFLAFDCALVDRR